MSLTPRVIVAVFEREHDLLAAIQAARAEAVDIIDVFTPYAMHGVSRAMGLRRSRLPRAGFLVGALAAVTMMMFMYWVTAVNWPINVGGKPWNSWPAFLPVAFEVTVLASGVSAVLLFLLATGLRPGAESIMSEFRVTDDRFVVVIQPRQKDLSVSTVQTLLARFRPVAVEERDLGSSIGSAPWAGSRSGSGVIVKGLIATLTMLLLISIGLNVAVRRAGFTAPALEYFPDMVRTARFNAYEANDNFPDGATLRVPPAGTIPRGLLPLSSDPSATPDGTLVNPVSADDRAAVERGAVMFETFCVPCHGATGEGDGLVVQHGFPSPPSLLGEQIVGLPDGEIFSIITNGYGAMPSHAAQIAREDRWKTILHLRRLQNRSAASASGR